MNPNQASLSIYGCGGTGANLVQNFVTLDNKPGKPFFAPAVLNVFDTSHSNVVEKDNINRFIVPGLSGAGKERAYAYKGVNDHVVSTLNEHRPSDFNIVVFGAAGGSGSVLGPLVAQELLTRGASTICIVIGTTGSEKETNNTIKTLQSLQTMAMNGHTNGRPIPMIYLENGNVRGVDFDDDYRSPRTEVDLAFNKAIRRLGVLMSGNHAGLDKTDLINWLDYSRTHATIPAQLTELRVFNDLSDMEPLKGKVTGTASLLHGYDDPQPELNQPYGCEGHMDSAIYDFDEVQRHYFALTPHRIRQIFSALEDVRQTYADAAAELASETAFGVAEAPTDGGMVL